MELTTKLVGTCSALDRLYQSGSAKCLFPRNSRAGLEAVLLNTAGGVTGGDRLSFSAQVRAGTRLSVTTQACERAYRAQPGETGQVRNHLSVATGARMNWLPQETILYDGSSLDRRLSVEIEPGASLLMVEPLVFGRIEMGESLNDARFCDRIEITRRGRPIFLDATRLQGGIAAHLAKPFIANGAGAMALLVYLAENAEAVLPRLRQMLPECAGASLIGEDLLVMRVLAADSFLLRQSLLPALRLLNNNEIPRCWTI
ncbi:urease accessory protein UreD [Ruegeria pomeroyi]|uniref:Urease accessory protein UreD n=2 Tax=Ruegeria pomeroyi TaxID=89184 RepID=URED_RUEPO|nr:urease accessory protein UreD [Ruegeria pomeroyi]Q5LSQ5.1 RecName: Full=Urease accessory protein UreD [Ruegeria pomeroyi DSS-3]HCE71938.1 urease accessory protein UreD [Ruegeria sp.]AAV94994.1 urease accessory protein UreD [Ruegeria pomeroyi DSS-3]NVK99243.1 urease accessory protein UreD [Ruegeria pomeroyi]NVL02279.1 urease accessory protein UreD [Ruegeria pomeroyi]QWV08570.1 urease accessory protein UreD [Ruegeria pomeroyi]